MHHTQINGESLHPPIYIFYILILGFKFTLTSFINSLTLKAILAIFGGRSVTQLFILFVFMVLRLKSRQDFVEPGAVSNSRTVERLDSFI